MTDTRPAIASFITENLLLEKRLDIAIAPRSLENGSSIAGLGPSGPLRRPLLKERRPLPTGATDQNPLGLSIWQLIAEDWRTHDRSALQPGFWVVAVHRFGNWRMNFPLRLVRAPLTLLYRFLYTVVSWTWGIDIGYTVKLGRRVRIWHHGGIVIGAHSIGDDVHIRQNTTLGVLTRDDLLAKPTVEHRVDIGAGACILGDVTVGHDSIIGANSVVVKDVPAGATMFGVPARPVNLPKNE